MKIEFDVEASGFTLGALLEALTVINVGLLEKSSFPPLYQSGVRYRREPKGSERWKRITRTFRDGHGDCEDLAAWRAAELRQAGELGAVAIALRTGPKLWHAVVWRENGDVEDPSRKLGMKGRG